MKYLEDEKLSQFTLELTDAVLAGRAVNGRIETYTMKRSGTDKKIAHALGKRFVSEMEFQEEQLADFVRFQKRARSCSMDDTTTSSSSSVGSNETQKQNPKKKQQQQSQQRSRSKSMDDTVVTSSSSPSPSALAISLLPPKTPYGDFSIVGTRRLMTDLILTLNASFPDYDFGSVRPAHFVKTKPNTAIGHVNQRLSELASQKKSNHFLQELWNSIDDVICLAETEVYSYVPPTVDEDPFGFLTQTLLDEQATPLWAFNYFFVNKQLKRILLFSGVETMRPMEVSDEEQEDIVVMGRYKPTEIDFDLDPAADMAGGFPISGM